MAGTPDLLFASASWDRLVLFGFEIHVSVLIGVVYLASAYLFAVGPARQKYGWWPKAPSRWRKGSFLGAVALIFLALNGPLHTLSDEYLFSAHMVQHMLLMLIMPPFLIMGLPHWLIRRALERPWVERVAKILTNPVVAFLAYNVTFIGWHIPQMYNWALVNHDLHILQHLMFMAVAVMMWWPVVNPVKELERIPTGPLLMMYVFAFGIPSTVVSAFITLSDTVFYPWYEGALRVTSLSPLEDQRLGGLIMWIPGMLIFWVGISAVFFRWTKDEYSSWGSGDGRNDKGDVDDGGEVDERGSSHGPPAQAGGGRDAGGGRGESASTSALKGEEGGSAGARILGLILPLGLVLPQGARAQDQVPGEASSIDWTVESELGASVFFGATDQTTVATELGVNRQSPLFELETGMSLLYGETTNPEGESSVNKRFWRAEANLDYQGFSWVNPYVFGTALSNLEKKISRRYKVGSGAKLTLLDTDVSSLDLAAAVAVERTLASDGSDQEAEWLGRWTGATRYRRSFSEDRAVFETSAEYNPKFQHLENFTLEAEASLAFRLSSVISLKLSVQDQYDNQAKERGATSNNDGQVLVSVLAAF